jgi:hypothetical protein
MVPINVAGGEICNRLSRRPAMAHAAKILSAKRRAYGPETGPDDTPHILVVDDHFEISGNGIVLNRLNR